MQILNLQAENFRILKAIEIAPDGNVVTIGGKNGQGKSSVLDAIWVALAGRSKAPPTPIRNGQQKCTIRLDLGDIVVTRTLTAPKEEGKTYTDSVKVTSADGKQSYNKPQLMLDDLMGQIGFDPFDFVKRKPDDQAAMLLELVPLSIDIEELAREDTADYQNRTAVNREVATLDGQIAGIRVADGLPAEPVDREAILGRLSSAADTNSAIERERMRREGLARDQERRALTAQQDRQRAKELQDEADRLAAASAAKIADAVQMEAAIDDAEKVIAALPALDQPVDTGQLRTELTAAEATNAQIAEVARRAQLVEQRAAKAAEVQRLTDMMASRELERRDALSKARMPVEGLGFGIDGKGKPAVLFNGLPFGDASSAEQIRASTAIAMAGNPELRVLRIKDGSLLDEDSMAIIREMAEADDWQMWIELVGSGNVGIVIEDGSIKGAGGPDNDPPAKEAKPAKKAAADKPEGSLL
jgi:hypothetical protein